MYRGFIKCWRCAEDSRAWSRGALHRGVMLTILLKVAWKDCYYRGDELKAGQFAFSGAYLAEECQLSRTTLLSILDDLEQDGFLTRRSVGNKLSFYVQIDLFRVIIFYISICYIKTVIQRSPEIAPCIPLFSGYYSGYPYKLAF